MNKGSKKKGLSMEEKCEKIAAWLVKHPHPYTLKELTTVIPRATGVIWQSIEECMEQIVSEGLVRQDKVGVHTLFWCFPNTQTQAQLMASGGGCGGGGTATAAGRMTHQERLALLPPEQLREQHHSLEAAVGRSGEELCARQALVGPEESIRRDGQSTQALSQERLALSARLQRLAAFNPQLLADLRQAARAAYDAANRWTDNFFLLEQHMTARMGQSARELRGSMQVPAGLDYIGLEDIQRPCGVVVVAVEPPPAPAPVVRSVVLVTESEAAQTVTNAEPVPEVPAAAAESALTGELPACAPPAAPGAAEVGLPPPTAKGRSAAKGTKAAAARDKEVAPAKAGRKRAAGKVAVALVEPPAEEDAPATTAIAAAAAAAIDVDENAAEAADAPGARDAEPADAAAPDAKARKRGRAGGATGRAPKRAKVAAGTKAAADVSR